MLVVGLFLSVIIVNLVAVNVKRLVLVAHLLKRVEDVVIHSRFVDSQRRFPHDLLTVSQLILSCLLHD